MFGDYNLSDYSMVLLQKLETIKNFRDIKSEEIWSIFRDIIELIQNSSTQTKIGTVIISMIISGYLTLTFVWGKRFYERWYNTDRCGFGYTECNGPHTWINKYPLAGGQNQSPILITTNNCTPRLLNDSLIWIGYNLTPRKMFIKNERSIVSLKIVADFQILFQCGKNCITGPYAFQSIDFHWSQSNYEGTEHRIDNQGYALEMQVVHTSNRLIPTEPNGISTIIISYLFEISEMDNPNLIPIVRHLHHIVKANSQHEIEPFPLQNLCTPFVSEFFSYVGSLTQPPCRENVLWIIHAQPLPISLIQIRTFRALRTVGGDRVLRNCRPTQNLNERNVYFNDYDCQLGRRVQVLKNAQLFRCYCMKINNNEIN